MRRLAAVIMLVCLWTAGCSQPPDDDAAGEALGPQSPSGRDQTHADNLTARLAPASGPSFPNLFVLDQVDLPAGGNISFSIGLGMRCDGNATGYADAADGWLECSVRLASDPSAMSRDRRSLTVGFDYQILTQRTAAEPIQWRVELEALNAAGNTTASFDSGWRDLDLTPVVTAPTVVLTVLDACDWPDVLEVRELGKRGHAELNVSFTSALASVNLTFSFAASQPGVEGGASHRVLVDQTEHSAVVTFPQAPTPTPMWVRFPVSIETEASPPTAEQGPCRGAWAHETQSWTVAMAYATAESQGLTYDAVVVPVDVYLSAD